MAISKEEFRLKAAERIKQARQFCSKWHKTARDEYDFVAGEQWKPEDMEALRLQNRPDVTFNYSEKMIDAVVGAEVSNRQEVSYKPRTMDSAELADLWTNAARWVRDECNAEDEETDAFRDALICGMGWTQTRMDYTEDKDGMPVVERIDPMEMYWDPAGNKPGLADRRFDVHGVWMDDDLIRARWPREIISADLSNDSGSTGIIRTGHRYLDDNDYKDDTERHVDQTMVWNYQCVELEPYYRVATGDGNIAEVSAADFGAMRAQLDKFGLKYVKELKKVYYRAFLADETILEWGLSPCQHGFTRNCITGKRDRNKNLWYGLTRVMKDPQRWANKWLSQIMHIINSNAKGGLMAETNAFVDPRKAEDEWAMPNAITWLNEGGMQKVEQKQMTAYPSGLAQLMEFALNSLPQVTGINLEALGLADRDQANVLEQSRKQAAYGLLAPVFDSLRRYRKMQGKVLLYFIREFISDGRLIKINGVGSTQFIPLTKPADAIEFDIIVDQSPSAPDVKDRTWQALMQIAPVLIKEGVPMPPDLLTYAPLPQEMIMKWQQFMQKQAAQSPVSPQAMQQMQQQMQQLQDENQKLKANDDKERTEMALKAKELEMKGQQMQFEMKLKEQELGMKMSLEQQTQEHKIQMERQSNEHAMGLKDKQQQGDLKIKAATAGLNPDQKGEVKIALDTNIDGVVDALGKITENFAQSMQQVVSSMNAPKQIVRDANGRPVGVKPAGTP